MKSGEPSSSTVAHCISLIHNYWDVLLLSVFFFCLFPSCFCSWGNQSVTAFKTSLKARANLCSVKELYWESRLWSKLVAEIHFNAFLLTHFVKIKPRSSVDIRRLPSPACKLWTSRKNLRVTFSICSRVGIRFLSCLNPPPYVRFSDQCL